MSAPTSPAPPPVAPAASAALPAPIPVGRLAVPFVGAVALLGLVLSAVALDQGALASLATAATGSSLHETALQMSDSGGALHELFHDARHLLGVPCH